MMALDVAVRLKRIETNTDPAPMEKALANLISEVENVLK